MTVQDIDMQETFNTIDWKPLDALSRRIGQRYGFAPAALNRSDVALLGGVVHFDLSLSQSAKGDLERGNPVPFSQIHCVGNVRNGSSFSCTLLSVKPTSELPCPRLYHSASRLNDQSVIIFGGQAFNDKRKLADIWCLDVSADASSSEEGVFTGEWTEITPASRSTAFPPPRSKHAVSSAGNNILVVSGGCGFEETVLGDLWVAHIEVSAEFKGKKSVVWKKVNSPIGKFPSPRKAHALSPLVSEIELMLHGGVDGNGNHLSDLWICQFVNEEKSRCVWTELVKSPHPRSGHVLFPTFGGDDPKGDRHMMVFGGNQPAASRYNIDSGAWSSCYFREGLGHTFTATELDVVYRKDADDDAIIPVPSVLLIPDTVIRSSQSSSPWLGLIFPIDLAEPEEEVKEEGEQKACTAPPSLVKMNLEANAQLRKSEYRAWAHHLPSLPPVEYPAAENSAIQALNTHPEDPIPASVHSPLFVVDYFARNLWERDSWEISVSSWSTAVNPNKCHVVVTGTSSPLVENIEEFKFFVNSAATAKAVGEVANSCLVVTKSTSGDRFIGFVSDALQRHSGTRFSPVISVTQTDYAQVQATMKIIMRYTPFQSPAALEDLFALFQGKSAGLVLVDFDGESSPISSPKDSVQFWLEALRALQSVRPRVELFALTYLEGSGQISVNGVKPSADFVSVLKSKLLTKVWEGAIEGNNCGPSLLLGKMKDGPNVGVLVYSNGVLVRHLRGRFAFENGEDSDQVTGLIDVEGLFTPVDGALSDFQEAADSENVEWAEFVLKVEQACLVYLGR